MTDGRRNTVVTVLGCVVLLAIYALPLYWLLATSFKSMKDVFAGSAAVLFTPTVQAYVDVWNGGFATSAVNSLIIAVATTVIVLVIAVVVITALLFVVDRFAPGWCVVSRARRDRLWHRSHESEDKHVRSRESLVDTRIDRGAGSAGRAHRPRRR